MESKKVLDDRMAASFPSYPYLSKKFKKKNIYTIQLFDFWRGSTSISHVMFFIRMLLKQLLLFCLQCLKARDFIKWTEYLKYAYNHI